MVLIFWGCHNQGDHPESVVSNEFAHSDSLVLDANQGLVLYRGEPFTGISKRVEGEWTAAETMYAEGKKNGRLIMYFANGTKSYEGFYKDGRHDGVSYSWWSNGQLRSESWFKEGVPHGVQKQWYSGGALFKELNLADGKEEGLQRSWRENGKIYSNYIAKNGRIFGLKRAELCYSLGDETIQ